MKFFNTAGRCIHPDHYMLPGIDRLDIFDLERLIAQKAYFVLHAPRQTGKTTAMFELAHQLTESGDYIGVVVSMEVGAAFPNDVGAAEDAILYSWRKAIQAELPKKLYPSFWKTDAPAGQRIGGFLSEWALEASRPQRIDLCLFYDDIQIGMELKVWRDGTPDPLAQDLQQLDRYLNKLALDSGWLVIFDQRSDQPDIRDRTHSEYDQTPSGKAVRVIRA